MDVLTATDTRLADAALAWPARPLILTRSDDADAAAFALATGGVIAHGFGNFYVITTRADAAIVRSVNIMKGRPPAQTGSITTHAVAGAVGLRLEQAAAGGQPPSGHGPDGRVLRHGTLRFPGSRGRARARSSG